MTIQDLVEAFKIEAIAVGNGTAGAYTGTINTQQTVPPLPNNLSSNLLQYNVLLESLGTNGVGVSLVDIPVVDPATGAKTNNGNLYDPNSAAYQAAIATPPTAVIATNTINYLSGVFTATFSAPVTSGSDINSQAVALTTTRPTSMLYYNNEFTIRPIPDAVYRVEFEVYQRPTALIATGQAPELEEYWQYIAYGAAKKIFEDKMDLESVQMIMPELRQQELLVNRRTIVQITNQRSATIYSENSNGGYNFGWGGDGQY